VGHVATTGEMRNTLGISVQISEEIRPLGKNMQMGG
jgi:hypothetical protein